MIPKTNVDLTVASGVSRLDAALQVINSLRISSQLAHTVNPWTTGRTTLTASGSPPLPQGQHMIKGFKDFILRGNVVDLAIAVVIGAAFATVVTAFTKGIIQPLIASIGAASPGAGGLDFRIRPLNPATLVDINGLIAAAINFLIVATVIYFLIVVPMNLLMERRRRGEEPEPAAPAEDIQLLQEIRDLLRDRPLDRPQADRPQG
jgi:large conductance mechanosensitive channel